MMYRAIKRMIDIAGASLCLVVFAPVMFVTAIVVRTTMGSPVIFKQVRPGKDKKPFTIYKFRSMRDECDKHGKPLSDAERLTKIGDCMRRWSLDELPQFFNILKGDMSFVGPRPLLFEYFPYYSDAEMRRHEVRPGVTGWAQVSGRNNINWDTKLALDVWYVDHASLWLDIVIIFKTVAVVLGRKGVNMAGCATYVKLDEERQPRQPAA